MPWTLSYLEETRILLTVYTNPLTLADLKDATMANVALATEKQSYRYLGDCTALAPGGSTLDIYQFGCFLAGLGLDPASKEAIVLPLSPGAADDLRFYETVTRNRGIDVRVFEDRDDAIRWLIE